MNPPVPTATVELLPEECKRLRDGDSDVVVDVEQIGPPYTTFEVPCDDQTDIYYVLSATALSLESTMRLYADAGLDDSSQMKGLILRKFPKLAVGRNLIVHRVARCKCLNCRRDCDDYNPEHVCDQWKGWVGP